MTTRSPTDMPTHCRQPRSPSEETAKLVDRVRQLRAALEASTRGDSEVRRRLFAARAESRRLPLKTSADRMRQVRTMLSDRHSRNP